jgi:hypothetical protein
MSPLIAILSLVSILQTTSAANLRIVVLEGEDAVNVIQQKTAVRPLVEVRDRNNVPVAGASVTFTVGSGQPAAFAGGAQTLTVTTNASGQAAATGFSATGPGAVQIQVQAAHQGQIATAAISQPNFATAAAAAAAGATAGAGAAAGGASSTGAAAGAAGGAAAGGGGISAVTIGVIGGAVGVGAVVATQVTKSGGEDGRETKTYSAQFNGQMTVTTMIVNSGTCMSTRNVTGSVSITLATDGSNTAVLDLRAPQIATAGDITTACIQNLNPGLGSNVPVSGGPSNLSFTVTNPSDTNETQIRQTGTFTGSLSGEVINGTLTYTEAWSGNSPGRPQNVVSGGGTISFQLGLR